VEALLGAGREEEGGLAGSAEEREAEGKRGEGSASRGVSSGAAQRASEESSKEVEDRSAGDDQGPRLGLRIRF